MKSMNEVCPACHSHTGQVKAGLQGGRQRLKCTHCGRRYVQVPRQRGYSDARRQQATTLFAQGMSAARISRQMGISAQSVRAWLRVEKNAQIGQETQSERDSGEDTARPLSLPSGKKRPTINDVARQAGVSRSTVSNYLNRKGRMSLQTRARVSGAMDALHFTPSALVQSLRRNRTAILGVLIFGLNHLDENVGSSLTPPLLAGISEAADAADHNLLLYTGWPRRAAGQTGLEFLNGHIDGLVWVAPALHDPALERLATSLPVMALLTRHVPEGVGYVNIDNARAVSEIMTHLIERGHRRIAYFGSVSDSNSLDRRAGYRLALTQQGIPRLPAWEAIGIRTDTTFVQKTLDTWLTLPQPPSAIVAANDGWAAELEAALQQRGLHVPQDIAVTGFNDVPNAQTLFGGLTTARQPFHEMGQIAAQRLLALIEGAPVESCRIVMPAQIIVRASTAPPRSG